MINRVLQLNISQVENSFNSHLEKHLVLNLPNQPNPNPIQSVIERGNLWSKKTRPVHKRLLVSVYPQYTRAWYARKHSTDAQMSPTLRHGSGATVATVPQSLRSVHKKTRQDETVCVSVIPNQNLWSESVQSGSDPVTDRVDKSVVQRVVFPSCGADNPEDRGDSASAVPGVLGQREGCRHDH